MKDLVPPSGKGLQNNELNLNKIGMKLVNYWRIAPPAGDR